MGLRVVASNFVTPDPVLSSEELAPMICRSSEWINERAGVHTRHVAKPGADPAALAADAAQPLVAQYGAPDLLLYAGAIPRQVLPDTSAFVHRELGLQGVPSFSVNAACLSFLTALKTADALIASGDYQRVLICVGEVASVGRNVAQPESAALLGDGAAAVLVDRSDDPRQGMIAYRMETWSEGAELAAVPGGGVMRCNEQLSREDLRFDMDGKALLKFTTPRLLRFLNRFFDEAGITPDEVDLVVPHQTSNAGMRLLSRIGFGEERVVNLLADYGNCVAASLPMALAAASRDGRLVPGSMALLLGTAAGVSIGATLFRW